MNWTRAFSTAIGKKLIMGATGLFLVMFLVVHCYINAMVFWNDGGIKFNIAASFMGSNIVIRLAEIGLMVFLIWHSILGLKIYFQNRSKRSVKYEMHRVSQTSNWYSRSMAILGTLILLFLILHLRNFWVPSRFGGLNEYEYLGEHYHNLYIEMVEHFSLWWVVVIYVLGCIALSWHLVHGFWSAFQTFGLTTHRYKDLIQTVGVGFAIIIPALFASMPIWFYLGSQGVFEMTPTYIG